MESANLETKWQKIQRILKEIFGIDHIPIPQGVQEELDNQMTTVVKNVGKHVVDLTGGQINDINLSMIQKTLVSVYEELCELTKNETYLYERFSIVDGVYCSVLQSWVEYCYKNPRTSPITIGLLEAVVKVLNSSRYIASQISRMQKKLDFDHKPLAFEIEKMKLGVAALINIFRIVEESK